MKGENCRQPKTPSGTPLALNGRRPPDNLSVPSHFMGNTSAATKATAGCFTRLQGGREKGRGDTGPGSSAKGLGNPLSDGREKRRTRTTWKKSKKHSSPRPETTPTIPGSPPNTGNGWVLNPKQTHTTLGRRSQLATARPTCEQANPSWSASGTPHLVSRGQSPRQKPPKRVLGPTSGGATLLEAVYRPNTRLTIWPSKTSCVVGGVSPVWPRRSPE